MTPGKRAFDILLALFLIVVLAALIGLVAAGLLLFQGRPILFLSDRMKTPCSRFVLLKFRTMTLSETDSGVSGGDKAMRITKIGSMLRRSRLDELPQIWNILRGDMSFVGPRPPLAMYVEKYPAVYARVLQDRPGLTGLATLTFHKREQALLANCVSAAETDAVYMRRCIPTKARLDLIYQKKKTLLLDFSILVRTASRLFKK